METLQSTIFIEFDVNTKKITFLRGDNIVDYDSNVTSVYVRVKYKNLSGNTVYLTPSELEDYKFSLYTIKPATNNVNVITGKVTDELKENVCGGVVKFEIPRTCTNRLGIVKCEIHINQGNKTIASSTFVLDVKQSLVTAFDDELLGDEDFPVLKQLILEIQKASNIDDNNRSKITSYSSDKVETIKENLKKDFDSQIKDKANFDYVDEQISKAQLEGAGVDTSVFLTRSEFLNSKPNENLGYELNINQSELWEEGTLGEYNNGIPMPASFPRLRTKNYVKADAVVKNNCTVYVFEYDTSDNYIRYFSIGDEVYVFDKSKKYKLVYKNNDDAEITHNDICSNVVLLMNPLETDLFKVTFWEHGSLNDETGGLATNGESNPYRIRTKDFISYNDVKSLEIRDGYTAFVYIYSDSITFDSYYILNGGVKLADGYLYKIVIKKDDNSEILLREFDNVIFNNYSGSNSILVSKKMWVQGYFQDEGQYSDDTSSIYYNKRIVTKKYIDIKNINRIICDFPLSVCYYQYDNDDNFVYRSTYSDVLDIPDCSGKYNYKLQVKDASEREIHTTIYNKITFINRNVDTIYNKSCNFAPVEPCDFYTGLQSNYSLFNRDTTVDFYYEKLNELIDQSNSYITKTVMGKDASNTYDIYKLVLSPTEYAHKDLLRRNIPHIIIISGQHGFEKSAPYGLYYFMKDLIENWDKNPILEYLRFNCKLTILPIANPWGFDRVKYENSNNVNLNRNYNLNFETKGSGASPLSEIESQYVASIIDNNKDAIYLADFHNNGATSLATNNYINWHSHLVTGDPVHDSLKYASKYQIENITRHFKKIYGIDNEICGYMDYATLENGSPTCQGYATTHGIIAQTFEGFNGFAGREHFNGETAKANSELIGNWLITVLLHYKKFYDIG